MFGEIKARTKETDLSVPSYAAHSGGGAYWYYMRTVEGSEYPIYCRAPGPGPAGPRPRRGRDRRRAGAAGRQRRGGGHEFFSLGAFDVSPDGRLLAYSTDLTGDERFSC